jgi:hypothetical protein
MLWLDEAGIVDTLDDKVVVATDKDVAAADEDIIELGVGTGTDEQDETARGSTNSKIRSSKSSSKTPVPVGPYVQSAEMITVALELVEV